MTFSKSNIKLVGSNKEDLKVKVKIKVTPGDKYISVINKNTRLMYWLLYETCSKLTIDIALLHLNTFGAIFSTSF